MVDLEKAIRTAIRTGRVELGLDSTLRAALNGRARLIVVSKMCPGDRLEDLKRYASISGIPLVEFEGSSADLGRLCRKPFQVSSVAVIDPGESNILSAYRGA